MKEHRDKEIFAAALEHAKKYGMEKDFFVAYNYYKGDVLMALEDWDLLSPDIIERITSINEEYED